MEQKKRGVEKKLKAKKWAGNKSCWDTECPICLTEAKGKCNRENSGYSIQCQISIDDQNRKYEPLNKRRYIMHGETARTSRVRCKEHKAALEKKESSNLWDHCNLEHSCEATRLKGHCIMTHC